MFIFSSSSFISAKYIPQHKITFISLLLNYLVFSFLLLLFVGDLGKCCWLVEQPYKIEHTVTFLSSNFLRILEIFLRFHNGFCAGFDHLALIVDFGYRQPLILISRRLLKNESLIITSADGKHEADGTPTAPPNWLIKGMLPYQFPTLWHILLFLLRTDHITLPNSNLVVLTDCGDHVTHETDVSAPSYVTHPVLMRLLILPSPTI